MMDAGKEGVRKGWVYERRLSENLAFMTRGMQDFLLLIPYSRRKRMIYQFEYFFRYSTVKLQMSTFRFF